MIPKSIFRKLENVYPVENLQKSLKNVRHLINGDNRQLCLTSRTVSEDRLRDGIGWFDGSEEAFCVFNEEFKGSAFEDFYNTVPYVLGRVRLMLLPPRTCYSYHSDKEPRLHIAIESNSNTYVLLDDDSGTRNWKINIPMDGHAYWIDTRRSHTAINTDAILERIHLVANIVSEK